MSWKLRPDRTIALRGFDGLGAAAAIHHASEQGFQVSGVFRDPADFAVLILYDADSFYEHLRFKYLPDFDFRGVVLSFDLTMRGLQPIDSMKYPTIDWPYLDVIRPDGTSARIRLSDHAEVIGAHGIAEAQVSVVAGQVQPYDRVTIWYQNYAFDYIAEGNETSAYVAERLAAMINSTSFQPGYGIRASVSGSTIRIQARARGVDGNHVAMYATWKNDNLKLSHSSWRLTGGHSDVTYRVRLDFSSLGVDQIRLAWLTFAPQLAVASEYEPTEWEAIFENWRVEDPLGVAQLRYASEASVMVSSESRWVRYSPGWLLEAGWFEAGYARRASSVGDWCEVTYYCGREHELWIGTALYVDRGMVSVQVDDQPPVELDCYLANEPQVITRRRVGDFVLPPGRHRVKITLIGKNPSSLGSFFYFDYLQAVVPGEKPRPIPASGRLAPANDYGTDHGYKLSPQRLMWIMDELGYGGEGNVYVSVFWWNQRKVMGRVWPEARIDFTPYGIQDGDQVFLDIGGLVIGKSCFAQDTASTVAYHFSAFLNEVSVGVWAQTSAGAVAIRPRAISPAYEFPVRCWIERGAQVIPVAVDGSLSGGVYGQWYIDPDQSPALNRAARDWLSDICREYAARERSLVLAYSMELLYPPDDPQAGEVWAARYPDGSPVLTDTGFANHHTTHCTFSNTVLAYHKRVFLETAQIMAESGIPIWLQFGEFLWWFFSNPSGMAFYDAWTQQKAIDRLGRPLHVFRSPDDDPSVNNYADAQLLADLLYDYCRQIREHVLASFPEAKFELLLALDVNHPTPAGRFSLGGKLNYFINAQARFRSPQQAPFDRLKIEALNFGAWSFDLNLAAWCIRWWKDHASWPRDSVRYNIPVFRGAAPWERECHIAFLEGIPMVMMWAFDHICLYSFRGGDPTLQDQTIVV